LRNIIRITYRSRAPIKFSRFITEMDYYNYFKYFSKLSFLFFNMIYTMVFFLSKSSGISVICNTHFSLLIYDQVRDGNTYKVPATVDPGIEIATQNHQSSSIGPCSINILIIFKKKKYNELVL
jgi:hypothetical protein